ncbi:MAG: EamA family transporter [Desulfobacterales bacterium]|nr:EamA family transporter [Desulfobacterales bacterium]
MSAGLLALLGAISFSFNGIVARRAVIKMMDASFSVLITIAAGMVFFVLILIGTGRLSNFASFSWQSYLWFSAAGIIHYILGRWFYLRCVQLVGANIAGIMSRTSPLVAVSMGVFMLGEALTWKLAMGILLIVLGVVLGALSPETFRGGKGLLSGMPRRAFFYGMGTGVTWGASPILVKFGLAGVNAPIAGALVSNLAAFLVLGVFILSRNSRVTFEGIKAGSLGLFSLIGLFSALAHLFRFIALSSGPASVVSPIFSTSPVFLLLLSFLFNRQLEVFNRAVVIGIFAVVAGTILMV